VTTAPVTNICQTTATSGGNVTSNGGADVTARGVCWSTSPSPTITSNHTSDGTGTGSFVSNITGLTAGTIYYVRAYATNSVGTSYGDQLTFTTTTILLATVTTNPVTNIKNNSATCGGNVTSDGGSGVTERGVCWNTSGNPTTGVSHTHNGSGTGTFTSYLTGLKRNTRYYVRAYATNANGTSYGNQQTFRTTGSWTRGEGNADSAYTSPPDEEAMVGNMETPSESPVLKLYPNPVRSTLTIAYDLSENSDVDLTVFNVNGVRLHHEHFNSQTPGTQNLQLNASSFPPGLYIVILTTGRTAMKRNFIKIN